MKRLTRRDLMKSSALAGGSLLLAPIAAKLQAAASGTAKHPLRFIVFMDGNGLWPTHVQPKGIPLSAPWERPGPGHKPDMDIRGSDTLRDLSMKDSELSADLEPLKEFKDRITVIQGLSGRAFHCGHSCGFGALSARRGATVPGGETIDVAMASASPSIFGRIGLGISQRPDDTVIYNVSAAGPNSPLPTQCRPDLAYQTHFGGLLDPSARKEFEVRTNLLDFVKDDVKKLQSSLAGPERRELDHYLNGLESMRDRRSRLNEIENTLRKQAPVVSDKYKSASETDRLDAHFDIAAAALIAGLTNVVTIAAGCGVNWFDVIYNGLGITTRRHGMGHSSFSPTSMQKTLTIHRFHMELLARLVKKLDAVPEGDGTMLDNTLVFYTSDFGEKHHAQCFEWPVVLLGGPKGIMKPGNRFLEYPKYGVKGHRTMANLYMTFLKAAGAPRASFGSRDPVIADIDQPGPLSELLV